MLDEMLRCATRWFDRIFVLDGTTDATARCRTDEILASYPEVVHHIRDEDLAHPVRDGARQYLLEESRRRYGTDHWVGILHADEFLDQDPRPMLSAHDPRFDPSIRVRVAHAFLHVEDRPRWHELATEPLRSRVQHLMWPGVPESRYFFDRGSRDYDVMHHGKVIPTSFRNGPLVDGYVITQYNERSPEQLLGRATQRSADGWQTGHYGRIGSGIDAAFTSTLDLPGAPFAPEFAGDPEGPFRPVHRTDVPLGPLLSTPAPTVSEHRGDAAVDLTYVTARGGLLDVLERRDRRSVRRWSRRMRGEWRTTANGGPDVPGYPALLRHTETVLRSPRASPAQRERVAHEFVRRLNDRRAPDSSWTTRVEANRAEGVARLLAGTVIR